MSRKIKLKAIDRREEKITHSRKINKIKIILKKTCVHELRSCEVAMGVKNEKKYFKNR